IGIVEDVLDKGLTDPAQPQIYSLARQTPEIGVPSSFIVRTTGDSRLVLDPLKAMVHDIGPSLVLDRIATLLDRVSSSLAKPRLYAILLGTFGASSLLISGVGLFGVLSYNVAQRTREFAVRTALGAKPSDVVGLILRQAMIITFAGLAVGIWTAVAFIQYIST